MKRSEIEQQHSSILKNNTHVKYLWMPFCDQVAVVTLNKVDCEVAQTDPIDESEALQPMRAIYEELYGKENKDEKVKNICNDCGIKLSAVWIP